MKDVFDTKYKTLLIIPFGLLFISLILIIAQIAVTGDFVRKDVSLEGGVTITIPSEVKIDIKELENHLGNRFAGEDFSVRSLKRAGAVVGVIIDGPEDIDAEEIIVSLEPFLGKIGSDDYSVTVMGSSLGASFFKETLKAIYISFLFMGIVIFWYFGEGMQIKIAASVLTAIAGAMMFMGSQSGFKDAIAYIIGIVLLVIYIKNSIPSFMVILNVFSDIIVTLAIVNLMGMKLSTAGIAAFLMIIGYSVDTNILLATKILKKKEGSFVERLFGAMKTGLTMTITTSTAILVAIVFTQSDVIKQIMIILLIGLIVDTIYTWLQNAGILRLYIEKKKT